MSKAFDLLSESLNDAILDTQTKHLPRHKRKMVSCKMNLNS